MKILHVQQFFNSGMGYQENLLPYYQAKLGHEVVFVTSTLSDGFNQTNRYHKAGESLENGFRVIRLDILFDLPHKFVLFRHLYQTIQAEKPDYIFHHNCAAPSIGTICRYKKNHPEVFLVLDNHSDLTISIQNPFLKWLYYNFIWKNYLKWHDRYIDLYFGVTPGRCLFLQEEYHVDPGKIRLLPLGADLDRAKTPITREMFDTKVGVSTDMFLFVHGGKMSTNKHVDRIIKAFNTIESSAARLILFGSLEDPQLIDLINRDDRIIFLGWLDRDWTLATLKFCQVGIWNTQHTTLLEDCVASGLPLVLRYYGSTSHLIVNSGIFLHEGSEAEIFNAMDRFIQDQSFQLSCQKAAQENLERLSYDRVATESVDYFYNRSPHYLHEFFMQAQYNRLDDPNYRNIKEGTA